MISGDEIDQLRTQPLFKNGPNNMKHLFDIWIDFCPGIKKVSDLKSTLLVKTLAKMHYKEEPLEPNLEEDLDVMSQNYEDLINNDNEEKDLMSDENNLKEIVFNESASLEDVHKISHGKLIKPRRDRSNLM